MNVPVTVIGSVVVCLLCFEFVCPNASGATSEQTRATIIFFMMPPFLMSQSLEPGWIEQEPVRIFATVQFENPPANGRVISRKRVQFACLIGNRTRRSGAGVRL